MAETTKKTVDVAGLKKAAQTYDKVLRTLPYFALESLSKDLLDGSLSYGFYTVDNELYY